MPPQPSPVATVKPHRPYFFYGHRKPTQNRPTVRGGLFSNRQTINPANTAQPTPYDPLDFDLRKWDPDADSRPGNRDPSQDFFSVAKSLSPIARYIVDSFRKHGRWGPLVVEDLNRLRRVTPKLVTEILKVPNIDPRLSSKFFYWAGKQKGYRHDFACYNAFAYSLNRTNQFRAADQIPELMHMQGKPPTEKQFEILIRMHADANRGLRVYYVYEKMKKFDIKPRVFLYNRIMDALVKTNHLDLALSVYDDFRRDGLVEETVTFMVLIKGLCKSGQVNEAIELLDQMRKNLCKPDVFAYTAMVKVLVSEGNLDGCSRVWEEMKRDGIEPDVMAYGTFITGLCKGNQLEKGYELFEEMKEKKCLIDRAIYGSLIEAFVTSGKVGSACDLLKDMMNSGYRADLAIYNCLIEGLCNHRLVDRAYKLLRVTVKEDLQPDFFTVSPILLSYAESKRMDDFISLLEQMQKLGFCIRDDLSKFFSVMVKKDNDIMLAWELFEELKLKYDCSVQSYNVLMEALHSIGKVKRDVFVLSEMIEQGCPPNDIIHCAIICGMCMHGTIEEARKYHLCIIYLSFTHAIQLFLEFVKTLWSSGTRNAPFVCRKDLYPQVEELALVRKYILQLGHAQTPCIDEKVEVRVNDHTDSGFSLENHIGSALSRREAKSGTTLYATAMFQLLSNLWIITHRKKINAHQHLLESLMTKKCSLIGGGLRRLGCSTRLLWRGGTVKPCLRRLRGSRER
nr:pentatricopeptide repeat-containing protein At4g20740 [Ipomoea batatas]